MTRNYELARPHVKQWWKSAVVYQIWPTSFKDSNGDGIGDLNGIESHLDYLLDLGIDVLWLSPIYQSPLVDMGYDISDYKKIDPRFGSVADVESLANGLHSRGCKLVLDLVVNHTSDQHAWFEESRSSKTNPKRDWYIWKPARIGEDGERMPPNNWTAVFGGSVWEWDEKTEEYYLHYFCSEQPDLNWEGRGLSAIESETKLIRSLPLSQNPEVRNAVWDIMKFWLDKGVDGFRMDVINMISKHVDFPDAEVTIPGFLQPGGSPYCVNGPRVHEFLQEMYREVTSKYDVLTVGEIYDTHSPDELIKYVHQDRKELQMCFDFSIVDLDPDAKNFVIPPAWTLPQFKATIEGWSTRMYDGGWWAMYLENHDQCRSISRWASPAFRVESGKMLALMQFTSFGTPYIYQGQELGMINLPADYPLEQLKDVRTINMIKQITDREGGDNEGLLQHVRHRARDNARSPMPWTDDPGAGFSSGEPWMMPNPDFINCNVQQQLADPNGVHAFFRRMIKMRHDMDVLVYGKFKMMSKDHDKIFAYTRTIVVGDGHQTVLVVLNFSDSECQYNLPLEELPSGSDVKGATLITGTYDDASPSIKKGSLSLRAYEGVLYQL